MAIVLKDRVKVLATTTGTGTFTLGSAVTGFQNFSVIGDGNSTYYTIAAQTTPDWEVGIGTYTASGTLLSRDTILESSNGGAAVDFPAGTKDVFVTYPAERSVYLDSAGSYPVQNTFNTLNATTAVLTAGTISTTPASGTDIVNKTYVDTIAASGIHFHTPVRVESPTALTVTYNNGTSGVGATLTNAGTQLALVIDGITLSVSDRVLIYTQTDATQNGVYVVSNTGSVSTNWVLTRATDADSYGVSGPDTLSEGSTFFVTSGNTGAGETYTCNTTGTITFGTTNITFAQISSAQIYSAGTGLTLTNTTFSITNTGTAGTYGSASAVPVFVTNAQGQVTSVTNTSIAIASGAVSGLAASATTDTTNASNITSGTLGTGRISGSYTGITGVGTLAAGTWNGSTIAANYGGTGYSSYTVGDLLYSDTSSTLAKLADVAVGNSLISGGVAAAPSWGKIGLATHVSGTLPAANGGTGLTSPGTSGNVLKSNGTAWTSAAPDAGGIEYVVKTANYTTQTNEGVLADTSGGAFTVTLPAAPSAGDQCIVADAGANFGTNNLTVGRNGSTIGGLAENLILDITGVSVQLVYDGTTWEVYAQIGGNGGTAVTLAGVQTLTNKTINGANNTITGISLTAAVTGTLPVANGGTGAATLTANNVLLGNGTSALQVVAPSTSGNVLTSNGTTWTSAAGATAASIQEFASSGTFTVPASAKFVMVELWGAGGGGGSGVRSDASTNRVGGSGGGGGAKVSAVFDVTDLTSTVSVTIGAGGTGGAAVTVDSTLGSFGTAGGSTSFGAYLYAYGGGRGSPGNSLAQNSNRGAGGGGSASAGDEGSGSNSIQLGGNPRSAQWGGATIQDNLSTGGAGSGGDSEYGGAGGGFSSSSTIGNGGSSIFAGAAGGGGGGIDSSNITRAGGAGGGSGSYTSGGGAAGGAAGGANNGSNGTVSATGGGGGGGGGGSSTTTAAGAGGTGATPAGGGGGGGASQNSFNSGAGGAGGNGFCRVYIW